MKIVFESEGTDYGVSLVRIEQVGASYSLYLWFYSGQIVDVHGFDSVGSAKGYLARMYGNV